MYHRLANGLESVLVNMGHVVVDGVPCGTEAALLAGGVIGDDVDAGYLGHGVDRLVVVGDIGAGLVGEHAAEAYHLGGSPHTVDNAGGVLQRQTFFIERGALTANHVEQDAIAIGLSLLLGEMGGPVLGTEGPRVAGIGDGAPLGGAPVFGIEGDEIDSDLQTIWQLTGELEHDGDTRGAIVGGEDGLVPVGLVGIVIGPGTAVPMGTDEDTAGQLGAVAGDDIGGVERGAVVALQIGLLRGDGEAETLELGGNPLATEIVGGAVHGAGTEGALLFAVGIGAVGDEGGAYGRGSNGVAACCLLAQTAREK